MQKFYANLVSLRSQAPSGPSPGSKALALREAQKWLREFVDQKGNKPYRHPFFWASFVLIGDGG